MGDELVITEEERKRLTTGRTIDRPKYTFFAMNKAVEYSGANRKETLGDVESIYEEFESQYPDGDFDDWKEFYLEEHDGEEKLEEATEIAYDKFVTIREAMKQIGKEDVHRFIEGFTLHGTYENQNIKEAAKEKLLTDYNGFQPPSGDVPPFADIKFEGTPFKIEPRESEEDNKTKNPDIRRIPIQEKSDGKVVIDLSSLNRTLEDF